MTATDSARRMAVFAAFGLIFIVNALITAALLRDGGFVAAVSALIAVVILLVPMLAALYRDLCRRQVRMHELVVLAVFASAVQGDFTTSALIAFFMLMSMIIETRTASGAHASLAALARLTPGKARRLRGGDEEEVESHELRPGDLIRVRPGENILADGTVRSGTSSINEANITGESLPVDRGAGEQVFAGTLNLTGGLEIEVVKAGPDTTLGRVRELILQAEASRLPFVRMIDSYIRHYTPVVVMLAATVLFFNRDQPDGLDRVVALLVVTCPIALILATPTAVVAALSAAARLGVLIKDVNHIEALARVDAMVFDKTGTLTAGVLEVSRLAPAEGVESTELLRAAAIAEAASNHPVARAVMALARKVNLQVAAPPSLHEEPGRGVRAHDSGGEYVVGNLAWMRDNGATAESFAKIDEAQASGMSLLFVLHNGRAIGWIGISDKPRADAAASLEDLRQLGNPTLAIVSGDRRQVVEKIGDELGISERQGEFTPAEKAAYVEELQARGHRVAFIGDGVNDGPALATSHIGIAMGAAGSDVALESATIALMNNELNRLPFLLRLSRRLKAIIVQNFIAGGVLIAGGTALSATGALTPIAAAAIQLAGALAVAMNSARLIRQGEELGAQPIHHPGAETT